MADVEVQSVGNAARLAIECGRIGVGIVAAFGVGGVAPIVGLAGIVVVACAGRTLVDGVFEIGGAVVFVDFDTVTPCGAVVGGGKVGDVAIAGIVPLCDSPSVTIGATAHGVEVGATAVAVAVIDRECGGERAAVGIH